MNAPDKIYYGTLDNVQCVNTFATSLTPLAYIRKDALLEWAKEMNESCNGSILSAAYATMINKIQSL